MKRSLPVLLALLAAGTLRAQTATVAGDLQLWATQMLDHSLRTNAAAGPYYNLRSEFKENGFTFRRVELSVSGTLLPGLDYAIMVDPSINTSSQVTTRSTSGTATTNVSNALASANPTILQDAYMLYRPVSWLEVKLGQFKPLQTFEGSMMGSTELLFAERSQLGRVFGDPRDRGFTVAVPFGDKAFGGKATVGVFNGMAQATGGKSADTNAQKDFVARLEFSLGKTQRFGAYTLQGSTDQPDRTGPALAPDPSKPGADGSLSGWPSQQAIYDNRDRTTNLGAYYTYQDDTWLLSAEAITGLLGRRTPTLGYANTTTGAAAVTRQHLDQRFLGAVVTAAWTRGHHRLLARFDVMDYNHGDRWYTPYNPYTQTPAGASTGNDYTPRFTETTLGWTYALDPGRFKLAQVKLNWIHRSANFLKPLAGQTGAQGGDSLVAMFQVAF